MYDAEYTLNTEEKEARLCIIYYYQTKYNRG